MLWPDDNSFRFLFLCLNVVNQMCPVFTLEKSFSLVWDQWFLIIKKLILYFHVSVMLVSCNDKDTSKMLRSIFVKISEMFKERTETGHGLCPKALTSENKHIRPFSDEKNVVVRSNKPNLCLNLICTSVAEEKT